MGEMGKLKKTAPELSKIQKEQPFGVPEKYFDDFSARLQMKIEAEKTILPDQPNRFVKFFKPALGLAAGFALIFMLVYWPIKMVTPKNGIAKNASPNSENGISDTQYRTIVEGMDENSFYALLEEPAQTGEISDDDLINYLSSNVSDYDIYIATE